MEEEDIGVEEAWAREIEKRIDEVVSGRVKTIPWEKARKRIEAKGIGDYRSKWFDMGI